MSALIGLDWGTTSLRAFRFATDGTVAERRESAAGILNCPGGDFEAALRGAVGDWLDDGSDPVVLASGMIGSRQGWIEAPYVACPAELPAIAGEVVARETRSGRHVHFVPGLSIIGPDGVPDVARGEETQIIGAMGAAREPRLAVLPGTHSKWAVWDGRRITWFATFMTGEVFAVLGEHSILGRLMEGDEHDPQSFERGLGYGARDAPAEGGLLKRLFSARSLGLFGEIPATGVRDYLSGLLIGTEISEATRCAGKAVAPGRVTVIGAAGLVRRYEHALGALGIQVERAPEDAAAAGQLAIARAAGLV